MRLENSNGSLLLCLIVAPRINFGADHETPSENRAVYALGQLALWIPKGEQREIVKK
jgi:hypothetical protein